jgi:hypothetical protein
MAVSQSVLTALAGLAAAGGSAAVAFALTDLADQGARRLRKIVREVLPDNSRLAARLVDTGAGTDSLDVVVSAEPPTLEDRLTRLSELMAQSALLSEQVTAELAAREVTARKLQEDAAQAEALASVNREQAEAVKRLVEADIAGKLAENAETIERNVRRDVRRDSIRIGIASFIAGGGLTLLITLLVHPLG